MVCRQISDRLSWLDIQPDICRNSAECFDGLTSGASVLLLDVAFEGGFPFRLIDTLKKRGGEQYKIILLPSIYNRTAYKKRPESLYGADAYLELHHIGDRLLPLLAEHFPVLAEQCSRVTDPLRSQGNERAVKELDLAGQASELARLLVADILLYHQDRFRGGLENDDLAGYFQEQLAEGRQLLMKRLPQAEFLAEDFIQQAFLNACEDYANA